MFFYRNRISRRRELEKNRKKELSPMISEFLFYEEDASKDEQSNYVNLKIEIRQLLKDDFNRKILSEVLLDLRKDISGVTQKRLFKLYQDMSLHNDDFDRLKSWRWEIISKGILNLTQMQVSEAYVFVTKFINDKRNTIRKQAEIAIVTLKPEGINYFLDSTKYKISEWQQLKLINVLSNVEDYQPPRFKAWLTSTNHYVVLFALRLIKFYNQNDADAALIELLKHKNNQIKEESIACIKEFHILQALPILKLVFWKSSTDVKISILNAIATIGSKADIKFLKLIEKKESNFLVKSKALSSINAIIPDSIMPSKGLINTSNYKVPEDIKIEENSEEANTKESSIEHDIANLEQNESGEQAIETFKNTEHTIIMDENQETQPKENFESINEETNSQENEALNLDFLPFVVQNDAQLSDAVNPKDILNDMLVDYEEVSTKEAVQPPKKKAASVEIKEKEIAFLPIVTDVTHKSPYKNIVEQQSKSITPIHEIEVQFEEVKDTSQNIELRRSSDYTEYTKPEILDVIVNYETVDPSSEETLESSDENHFDMYFKSTLSENLQEDYIAIKSNLNKQNLQSDDDMNSKDEQKFKKIIEDLIGFDKRQKSKEISKEFYDFPLSASDDEFLETRKPAEASFDIQDESELDLQDEIEQDTPILAQPVIPSADIGGKILEETVLYKEDSEESRMQLLDDLAELGDQRELPFLNELLINEKYVTVKHSIEKLIEKFSETKEKRDPEIQLKPFNVFEDLFRTSDTQAKLILMDEIVAVGDEAEISFLEKLLVNEELKISIKAAKVLEELKAKLLISDKVASKDSSDDKNTRVAAEVSILTEEEKLNQYDSLLEDLQIEPSQDLEIFAIDFELGDPLSTEEIKQNKKNNATKKPDNQKSILGKISALSTKIKDRFNG